MVKENEKPVFEAARTALHEQLQPSTPMQEIAFERTVCCVWRIGLATRMESRRLGFQSDLDGRQEGLANNADEKTESPQWYGSGRGDLRTASKFLLQLRQEIKSKGSLHLEEWKDSVVKTFGADFYNSLSEWRPVNVDAILIAEQLQAHSETFKMPLPSSVLPEATNAAADPRSRWDMMLKIIDLQLQHVMEVHRLFDVNKEIANLQDSVAVDSGARYYTTASRDLERAVDWYQELLERRL